MSPKETSKGFVINNTNGVITPTKTPEQMWDQPLFMEVLSLLDTADRLRLLVCALIIIIPGLIEGMMLMYIADYRYRIVFICMIQFSPITELYRRFASINVGKNVISKFLDKFVMSCWERLGFQSSMAIRAEQLMREARQAIYCLESMCGYGSSQIISLINTFISCMTIIVVKGQYSIAISIMVTVFIVYFFVIKGLTIKIAEEREISKERYPDIEANLSQLAQHQQSKTGNPSGIVQLMNEFFDIRNTERKAYGSIEFAIGIATNLGFFFLMFENDEVKLLMLIVVLNNIKNAVMNFVFFMSWYDITVSQYDRFQHLWKGAKFEDDVEQQDVPEVIKISDIDVKMGETKRLVGHSSMDMLDVTQGMKILLVGKSGAGKSSFINGFAGFTDGVTLNDGNNNNCVPASLRNCMLWFVQKTTDYTDTNGVTLISLFKNVNNLAEEPDRECMDKALNVVGLNSFVADGMAEQEDAKNKVVKELEELKEKLSAKTHVTDVDVEKQPLIEETHDNPKGVKNAYSYSSYLFAFIKSLTKWFMDDTTKLQRRITKLTRDKEFYEKNECGGYYKKLGSESGGEKQRICLGAFVVYKLFLQQKQNRATYKICILDEACKAIDPETGYAMYDALFSAFPQITFFVISHLERMTTEYSWNHKLLVADGEIKKF